jgi:hypothetical protein
VVGDPGVLLDHLRHPGQGPQVVVEPARAGAGQQDLLDPGELRRAHPRGPPGCATATQRVLATGLPAAIPAAHVLAVDAQLVGDLGLWHLTGEQAGRPQPGLLLDVTVAWWSLTHPAAALLG